VTATGEVGAVVATHVWPADAEFPVPVDPLLLDWGGPIGDRHHGLTMRSDTRQKAHFPRGTEIRNHRQVSLVSAEEQDEVATALGIPSLAPGLIADNLTLSGVTGLTALPRMTRLVFAGGVVLMLGGRNDPCTIAGGLVADVHGTAASAFPKAAWNRRGVTGWVEHPGEIRAGEPVAVHPPR
jgi:MOSC domain